jgi:predicted nucleic acid-binding protein
LRIYVDLNCFNRPFDDQRQTRVAEETAAVFVVLQRIVDNLDQLVWSEVLSFENSQHPLRDRSNEIARWTNEATELVVIDDLTRSLANQLTADGIKPLDAAHLACAELSKCEYFLTCDDRLIRMAGRSNQNIKVRNPIEYLTEMSHG